MGATDIHLINQGKGSGFFANKFLASNGSDVFVMRQVDNTDINWSSMSNRWYQFFDSTSQSLIDNAGNNNGIFQIDDVSLTIQSLLLGMGDTLNLGNTTCIIVNDAAGIQTITLQYGRNGIVRMGDINSVGNSTLLELNDSTNVFSVTSNTIALNGTINTIGPVRTRITVDDSGTGDIILTSADTINCSANSITIEGLTQIISASPGGNNVINRLKLMTTQTASSGNQMISPALVWSGYGWKTTATAASRLVEFRAYTKPVQGTTNPIGEWVLESQINSGGWSGRLKVDSDGIDGNTYIGSSSTKWLKITPGFFGGGGGVWLDMTTGGPSGIGSGGAGVNPWVAYSDSANLWFTGSAAGDICYRNTGGKLLFGNTSGAPSLCLSGDTLGIGTGATAASAKLHVLSTTEQLRLGYDASNYTKVTVASNGLTTFDTSSTTKGFVFSKAIRLKGYTIAAGAGALPAGTQGDVAFVTDALAPTFLGVLVGGGAVVTPVFYNGTAWVSF